MLCEAKYELDLSSARPMGKPVAFTRPEIDRLISWGRYHPTLDCPWLQRIFRQIRKLRGSSLTYAMGLRIYDLCTWSVKTTDLALASLVAPLTFFRPVHCLWLPKVIVAASSKAELDEAKVQNYHTACRRASIELLLITHDQIQQGYLESKQFHRAFSGAFFCSHYRNIKIFCPTLREMGYKIWEK